MSAPGFVYVMQADGPALKIGSSSDPERRRRQLQTGSAADLRILHTVPVYCDPVAVERAAQDMLSSHRVRLEWYNVPPDLAVGAIYAAAFRLGAMSPTLEAKQTGMRLWRGVAGALVSIPFWGIAAAGHPLGATAYLTVAITGWTTWRLLSGEWLVSIWPPVGACCMGLLAAIVSAAHY